MGNLRRFKLLAGVYLGLLLGLLVCVSLTPLMIRSGISGPNELIIEEDVLETLLILLLFGISCLLLRGFLHTIKMYREAADRTSEENATLLMRLADAFKYIGTVNVEIQAIESVLGGIEVYPQSRKEYQRCFERLAAKAMAIAGTPWIVIRIIDCEDGRTVKECSVERLKGVRPPTTVGNRAILENRNAEGFSTVCLPSKKPALLTACILPLGPPSDAERFLLSALLHQVEMLFRLYRADLARPSVPTANA